MNYPTKKHAAEMIIEFGRRMYEKNMVAANDGNLSVKIGENAVMITPSGVSKGFMRAEMFPVMDLAGNLIDGTGRPSSEAKMHLKVYAENPKIGGVAHAHPVFATAFAAADIPLDKSLLTESVIGLGPVPLAPFATPGTDEVPESITPFIMNCNGVLLAKHGALSWGKNLEQAFFRLEAIEHTAKIRAVSEFLLKSNARLTPEQLQKLHPFIGRFD
ncbi:MAG: class II aldolase/adducin family protein [Bacillota bacterium]|jgi:L-fuculose-phosphate aldolase